MAKLTREERKQRNREAQAQFTARQKKLGVKRIRKTPQLYADRKNKKRKTIRVFKSQQQQQQQRLLLQKNTLQQTQTKNKIRQIKRYQINLQLQLQQQQDYLRNLLQQEQILQIEKRIRVNIGGQPFMDSSLPYIKKNDKLNDKKIFVFDHVEKKDNTKNIRYYTTCDTFGPITVEESLIGREQTRNFIDQLYGEAQLVTQLHHINNPHHFGYYTEYVNQIINDYTCCHLSNAYTHNESNILVATSKNGTELVYLPNIFNTSLELNTILSSSELQKIHELRIACGSIDTLFAFKLTDNVTVRTALLKVGGTARHFHSRIPHL